MDAAAFDPVAAAEHQGDRFAIDPVLFGQNTRRQGLRRIAILHGNHGLPHDRAGVETRIHEVHRAAGVLHAIIERLLLNVKSGKRGKQRGVNVKDALRVAGQ